MAITSVEVKYLLDAGDKLICLKKAVRRQRCYR